MPVIDNRGKPLPPGHPLSGTRIIFGGKRPPAPANAEPPAPPASEEDQSAPGQEKAAPRPGADE